MDMAFSEQSVYATTLVLLYRVVWKYCVILS